MWVILNKWRLIIGIAFIILLTSCGQTTKNENVNGVSIMNITHKKGVYKYPTWSPDGQHIAFRFSGDVWIANADGTSSIQITDLKSILGRKLIWDKPKEITFLESDAFKKTGESNIINTVVLSEKGNKQGVLLENMPIITDLSWNPLNLSQLLVSVNLGRSEGGSHFPLHLYDVETGERKEIIKDGHSPKWSPNGKWISYTRDGGGLKNL